MPTYISAVYVVQCVKLVAAESVLQSLVSIGKICFCNYQLNSIIYWLQDLVETVLVCSIDSDIISNYRVSSTRVQYGRGGVNERKCTVVEFVTYYYEIFYSFRILCMMQ